MQKAEEVTIYPTRGYFKTAVKIRIPIPIYERLCQETRIYGKCGVLSSVLTQIFLYGYDYVEKSFGIDSLVEKVYKMRKLEKKKEKAEGGTAECAMVKPEI
jgi:hypothetical protein